MIAAALRPASLQVHARPACWSSVTEEQLQPLLVKTTKAKKRKKKGGKRGGESNKKKIAEKEKGKKQHPRQWAL
jgi:hypothetical protein